MTKYRMALHDEKDHQIGWLEMAGGWLPTHIYCGDRLFERYGQVNDYRYVEVYKPTHIPATDYKLFS